jgi:hypothetical protein
LKATLEMIKLNRIIVPRGLVGKWEKFEGKYLGE